MWGCSFQQIYITAVLKRKATCPFRDDLKELCTCFVKELYILHIVFNSYIHLYLMQLVATSTQSIQVKAEEKYNSGVL